MPLWLMSGDLAKMATDAVVNAANSALLPGGGVCGALHRAAGSELSVACAQIGFCETGKCVVTPGFRLKSKYVLHAVGPVWQGGKAGEEALLRSCYREALETAISLGLHSVAFPLISAGIYGYPAADALRIARETIAAFLDEADMDVYLVLWDKSMFQPPCPEEEDADAVYPMCCQAVRCSESIPEDLDELMRRKDESFSEMLLRKIIERDLTNAQCYKRANMDRKLFSKIIGSKHYRPKRQTALALAIALELDEDETEELLKKAGFALNPTDPVDRVVRYYIRKGQFDVHLINEALYYYDLPLLGSPMQ